MTERQATEPSLCSGSVDCLAVSVTICQYLSKPGFTTPPPTNTISSIQLYFPLLNHPAHKTNREPCRGGQQRGKRKRTGHDATAKYHLIRTAVFSSFKPPSADVSRKIFGIEVTSAIKIFQLKIYLHRYMPRWQPHKGKTLKIDPATLQFFEQLLAENAPAVRKIVQNVLDEPISQEMEKRLQNPLLPKPFRPRAPPRQRRARKRQELLREFDPLPPQNIQTVTDNQNEILDLYDEVKHEGEESKGRRFVRWRFIRGLEKNLTPNFMASIRENVRTAFYIRHVYSYQLRNTEDNTVIVHYTNQGSPWIDDLSVAEKWLSEQETKRLDSDNIKRPSTNWEFVSFFNVDVKVVLDRQQPLLGTGPLPAWLRNLAHGRSVLALDTYQDNLCLWRCIAVHRGARPDRSTTAARGLAKRFFKLRAAPNDSPKTSLDELERVERHLNQEAAFSDWLGIRVYEPVRVEDEVVWHLRRNPPAKLTNILTIGIYEGHAFVIKDISKLARKYACVHCRARFTQACHLQRHTERCAQGKTVIDCPAERVRRSTAGSSREGLLSKTYSFSRISSLARTRSGTAEIHIHHTACGHGGERWVERAPVDGYNHETRTVFQYHGCHWHGCRKCYPNDRDKVIAHNHQTREDRFKATVKRTKALRAASYYVIEAWACEVGEIEVELPRPQTQSFPHAILYDFEAYGDKNQRKEPTGMLTIENAHVPISVSVGDTLDREPTHICEKNPAELVRKFMEELERRGKSIRTKVRAACVPDDVKMLPKTQRIKIEEWCDQAPVLGFNSGR